MAASVPESLDAWSKRGRMIEVLGRRLFCIDEGPTQPRADADDTEPPTLLILHGFPTSSFDFHLTLDRLAAHQRVIVHDHLGFGLSDKPTDYSYSLLEQAEHALALWRELGVTRGRLLAHDYGTSVATELLARSTRGPVHGAPRFEALILCNGSMHIELAQLSASQRILAGPRPLARRFAKLSWPGFFFARIRAILGPHSQLPDAELQAMWDAVEREGGRDRLVEISSYLGERRRFWHRWIGALRSCELPTLVLWGRRDPIAVAAIAEQLAAEMSRVELRWLEDLGHFPMLEDPQAWVEPVLEFLARLPTRRE